MERYLRVNLLGSGLRLMKKEFTGPLRLTKVEKHCSISYLFNLIKQEADKCTYNDTLRCVRVTTVALEKQKYYIF